MSVKEHSESEFYYPEELQLQKNSEFTVLNYDRVGAEQEERNRQTTFKRPYNKLLINFEHLVFTGKSQTKTLPY